MRQAAKVAQAQDAVLEEKAKERRRKEEDQRRQKEQILMEKRKKESILQSKHQEIEKRQHILMEQKQQKQQQHKQSVIQRKPSLVKPTTKSIKPVVKRTNTPLPVFEKKKPVHISYEQLMEKAKEVSIPKKSTSTIAKDTQPKLDMDQKYTKRDHINTTGPSKSTSALYIKRSHPSTQPKSKPLPPPPSTVHARDRIRLLFNAPAQRIVRPKRDRQSIEEIQREIRHSKGNYSDNEEDESKKHQVKKRRSNNNNPISSKTLPTTKRPPPIPDIRMPFRRTVDPKRDINKRRRRLEEEEEEEEDDDLDSFIVNDEDDEDNKVDDYSSEISKLFRYDRTRYANESVYSDDDMEANPMDVIREEKRSERLGRREDQIEEQLELERRKKRLAKSKGK
ncbi:SPT2 chromatin protein-domain-containing protein [Chlamydoabsidia padenii]|nr:SPT2 chromatin protein-domain-containing protein [Chlamydoabsidia padenii]